MDWESGSVSKMPRIDPNHNDDEIILISTRNEFVSLEKANSSKVEPNVIDLSSKYVGYEEIFSISSHN